MAPIINFDCSWFSAIASTAALITAIAALISITQFRRFKKSSYKPELFVDDSYVFVYFLKNGEVPYPFQILSTYKDENPVNLQNHLLELNNIGLGTAKSISYKYQYDEQELISQLKVIDKNNIFKVSLKDEKLNISYLSEFGKTIHLFQTRSNSSKKLGFLVPSMNQDNSKGIPLPDSYLVIISLLIYLHPQKTNYDRLDIDSGITFPKLSLILKYHDFIGGEYSISYSISLEPKFISSPNKSDEGSIQFEVKVSPQKS